MITYATEKIYNFISSNIALDDIKAQIYKYGIELCISTIINVMLIVFTGVILGCFVESIIFLSIFIILRQYTGGYHADTYFKCNFVFLMTFLLVLGLSKILISNDLTINYVWVIAFTVATTLIVALLAPVKNHNKHISDKIRIKSRIISVFLWLLFCLTAFYLCYCGMQQYGNVIYNTIFSIMVLMIIGNIKERRKKWTKRNLLKC